MTESRRERKRGGLWHEGGWLSNPRAEIAGAKPEGEAGAAEEAAPEAEAVESAGSSGEQGPPEWGFEAKGQCEASCAKWSLQQDERLVQLLDQHQCSLEKLLASKDELAACHELEGLSPQDLQLRYLVLRRLNQALKLSL